MMIMLCLLGSPFLSVFDALQLCLALKADLRIASQGEIAVLSTHDCLEKVQKFVATQTSPHCWLQSSCTKVVLLAYC